MPSNTPFRLNRSGLVLALISAAFAGQAQAAAGRIEFAIGPVSVVGADGRSRPAARGIEVDSGDTVRTSDGRVQMRMTDGAFISLQPNTEFGIKEYKFEGRTDGSESAFYSLLKGAMRTVTGLIGRVNRNKYLVSTPTATVGIRGTGGLIQVLQDGGTLVQGTSGIWFLANPAGTIDVPAGVAGLAPADVKQPPRETVDIPAAGPSPLPPPPPFVEGSNPKLFSGDGYSASLAYDATGFSPVLSMSVSSAVFNGSGQMTQFAPSGYSVAPGGSHTDFGTDGILAWGRWVGAVTVQGATETYGGDQGFHYVVGLPTATMPTSGTATYTLLGATSPTYSSGGAAPGTFSGRLLVDFGGALRAGPSVDMVLSVGIEGKSYAVTGNSMIFGNTFGQSASLVTGGANGACGGNGCFTQVNGFFAGPSAERAGLAYQIDDSGIGKQIIGAAAFAKQ